MKTIIVSLGMLFLSLSAFCQKEANGTIYIKHPYIDAVNKAQDAYAGQDAATLRSFYADSAKFWASGFDKWMPMDDAIKMFMTDFQMYDSVRQDVVGYPDYLEYKKNNSMVVQSWWTWKGKSKKTGETLAIPMVIFDDFNKDGKIVREYIYGDFSKMEH